MTRTLILIALGGGAGSALRYLTAVLTDRYFHGTFPLATFAVNVAGCFLIGWLAGMLGRYPYQADLKALFITGFCGGYTTFSAFSAENVHLFQSGHSLTAIAYIAASILAGLLAVWAGMAAAKI
jgi:CrcB protein